MLRTFKLYFPIAIFLGLCIFGLFAPLVFKDVYTEVIYNSPTMYMPMVKVDVIGTELCSDPTKLHYNICGLDELTSVA